MCSPVAASMGAQAVGGAVQAKGILEKGMADENEANFLATQSEISANLAVNAGRRVSAGIQDNAAERSKSLLDNLSRLTGRQRAAAAATGAGAGSVTAQDIATDTATKSDLDQLAIRFNADAESAFAIEESNNKAWALREQAKLYRTSGKNARRASRVNAVSSLLGSASTVADSGIRYRNA